MFGEDHSVSSLGIIPLSIVWLFQFINEAKLKYGTKFTVKISAVEIIGKEENVKDLLKNDTLNEFLTIDRSKTLYENLTEAKVHDAEKALFCLDQALSASSG